TTLFRSEAVGDQGGVGTHRGLERIGEAVGRIGREYDGTQAVGGAAARGGGGNARLADPALAGIENGPRHRHASERTERTQSARSSLPCPAAGTRSTVHEFVPSLKESRVLSRFRILLTSLVV